MAPPPQIQAGTSSSSMTTPPPSSASSTAPEPAVAPTTTNDSFLVRHPPEVHRNPAVLGLFHVVRDKHPYFSRFIRISSHPTSPLAACHDLPGWRVLDCRHGRALFAVSSPRPDELLVWDPMTGEEHRLPGPSPPPNSEKDENSIRAAVLCAAEGCDHRCCHGGPFRVSFLCTLTTGMETYARVYSSETGTWSELSSHYHRRNLADMYPSARALVGDVLYFRGNRRVAWAYKFSTPRDLYLIEQPPTDTRFGDSEACLTSTADGGLGCTVLWASSACLSLCSMEGAPDGGVAKWAPWWREVRDTELNMLLPECALPDDRVLLGSSDFTPSSTQVLGIVEGTDVLFVGVRSRSADPGAIYMEHQNSGRWATRKVLDDFTWVFPYVVKSNEEDNQEEEEEEKGDDHPPLELHLESTTTRTTNCIPGHHVVTVRGVIWRASDSSS